MKGCDCIGDGQVFVQTRWCSPRALEWCCGLLLLAAGCRKLPGGLWDHDGHTPDEPPETPEAAALLSDEEQLGKLLFEDERLSSSGKQSCASCHAPERAFTGSANPSDPLFPVSTGADGVQLGDRNAPTAMYMAFSPAFGFVVSGTRVTATGGQFWDGRADTLADQALGPFLNPREMGMPSKAAVLARVKHGHYAQLFRRVYGNAAFDDVELGYAHIGDAIEAFELTERFAPFSSKFDAVLDGTAQLDANEANGLALFTDSTKGNCTFCHKVESDSKLHEDWLFTGFTYRSIGVPRNPVIPDNDDPGHFDLGLCAQPGITAKVPEAAGDAEVFVQSLCGAFKVPTLRNVATTAPYMHNGAFETLREAVEFYATRETHPEHWYSLDTDGVPVKYDDLPEPLRGNVSSTRAPFDREPGEEPRLSSAEIDDIVAFLKTLSDGYRPAHP